VPGWCPARLLDVAVGLEALGVGRARLGVLERGGYGGEPRRGEHGLDEREELALLEADVVGEAPAELVQDGRVERRVYGERVGTRADVDMVAQRSRDERVVRIAVRCVRRSRISSSSRKCPRPCSSQ
jgi:hypothetical protein